MGSSPETQLKSTHRKNQTMKFVYATLAGSAMAAQPLSDFLEEKVNSVFTETNDGFNVNLAPYFILNVADDGWSGKLQYSVDGQNMNVDNWDVSEDGGHFWGSAHGNNAKELGLAVGNVARSVDYDENCKWSASAQGLDLECDRAADIKFRNGAKGNIQEDFSLEVNVEQLGNAVSVSIDVDGERTAKNINQLEDYPVWYLMRPYTLTMNTNINVNDVVKCENGDFGCSLSIDSSINAPADDFNGDVKFSFDLKKFAAIFKVSGSDVDSQLLFVRKVAADGKGLPLDQNKGWLSIDVADAVVLNMDKLPYLFYYLDNFFATFSNEFDCSKYVAATKVESDLLADYFGVDTFNGFMQENCMGFNDAIVEAIQNDDLDDAMADMRNYVSKMNSPAGEAEFNSLFGSIF